MKFPSSDTMPCRLVRVYHILEGLAPSLFGVNQIKTPTNIGQQAPPKQHFLFTNLHGVIPQNMAFVIPATVVTSVLA
jgi:hypothetical protein